MDVVLAQLVANEIARGIIYLLIFSVSLRCFHRLSQLLNDFFVSRYYGVNRTRLIDYVVNSFGRVAYEVPFEAVYFLFMLLILHYTGTLAFVFVWLFASIVSMQQQLYGYLSIPGADPKLTELEENETAQKLRSYCERVGFPFEQIRIYSIATFSGLSTSAALGIGKRRTLVLFDTMFEHLTTDEVIAIAAHEIAHHQLEHNRSRMYQLILWDAMFWLGFGVFMQWHELFAAAGIPGTPIHVGYAVFVLMISPVWFILDVFKYIPWREHEFEADAHAAGPLGTADNLISALTKLTVANRTNPLGHGASSTHPSLLERIDALKSSATSQIRSVEPE